MSAASPGRALAPISDGQPAGENLELDPDFGALERASQGKPEVQYGSTIEAAVPPDWREVVTLADSLLKRTHDLRIMVHLAIARLHLDGLPGFAGVVASIRHEIDQGWAFVHPQLDPDDDNDPMVRSNALLPLRDGARVLRALRDVTLAGHPRKQLISWRDIAISHGALDPEPGREKVSEAVIQGAFRDTERDQLASVGDALDTLLADVAAIPAEFDRQAGAGKGPDYEPLLKLCREMHRDFNRYRAAVIEAAAEDDPVEAAAAGDGAVGAPVAVASPRAFASITAISGLTKREEALHALELAAGYFRTQEPSSPLPLLIERAKRLAGMEFMDILRDLAPDGLRQAELVTGSQNQ